MKKNAAAIKKQFWGPSSLPGEEAVYRNFGPLQIWIKSTADELWITYKYSDPAEQAEMQNDSLPGSGPDISDTSPPDDAAWQRWSLKRTYREVQLLPVFPDLPVVVKPEYPFRITRGVRTKIYVRTPVWVQISLGKTVITEIPSVVLSKTWFGSFLDGELCYWISSSARKSFEPDSSRPFMAICPIQINNRSENELLVEKVCLRMGQLALYTFRDQLWANETRASYRGQSEGSEIEVTRKAPMEAPEAILVASPRDETKKGFRAKTFTSIIDFTGLGFLQHR